MKVLNAVSQKSENFANERQLNAISISIKASIPFHSLGNIVDSGKIAHEKIRTQDNFSKLPHFLTL